jgi:hypothetical protein
MELFYKSEVEIGDEEDKFGPPWGTGNLDA